MPTLTERQQIEAIYQSAPVGLCVLDQDLRYVRINDRLAEINRIPASAHIGRTLRDVLPTVADRVEPVLRRVLAGSEPSAHIEIEGQHRTVALHCLPLYDEDRGIVGLNIVVDDITDRKHLERELLEADRRKNDFLLLLGHELRSPLAPILTAATLVRLEAPNDPIMQKATATIVRQASQLSTLVDDLLDVGRITAGKLRLEKKRVALSTIVTQAIETCTPLMERRGHRVEVSIPDEPIEITADATRIVQVICNLLDNAAKYTQPGSRIELTVSRDPGMAVITVRDQGVGIPPEMLGRIFERFVQIGTSVRREGGLGLGLSLVKSLVEMHGGTVEAHSAGVNQGSEFIVRLPVACGL